MSDTITTETQVASAPDAPPLEGGVGAEVAPAVEASTPPAPPPSELEVVEEAPPSSVPEVALDEVEPEPEPKKVKWRELELDLPEDLPATILFDLTMLELSGGDPMPSFRLLQSMVGADQFVAIRNEFALHEAELTAESEDEEADPPVLALLKLVFEQYGITLGE